MTRRCAVLLWVLAAGCAAGPVDSAHGQSGAVRESLDGPPIVSCRAWAVAEGASGRMLWSHNADQKLPMASTTKMMTAWLVLRLAEAEPAVLEEMVTISAEADATSGSIADVRAGETIKVADLLYGLLLPSGNDAANALAEHFNDRFAPPDEEAGGDGPVPIEGGANDQEEASDVSRRSPYADRQPDPRANFIAEMNRTARRMNMPATRFVQPHGKDDPSHHSSAADLIALAHHLVAHSARFRQIVGTQQYTTAMTTPDGSPRSITWSNTNQLLSIEGYDGIKTGTTPNAGACLVSSAHREGDHLLIVVLGATSRDGRYVDTRNLFRWAWTQRGHRDP